MGMKAQKRSPSIFFGPSPNATYLLAIYLMICSISIFFLTEAAISEIRFLQTGPYVYQLAYRVNNSSSQSESMQVITTKKGIFVSWQKQFIPFQLFDPAKLPPRSQAFFLSYSPKTHGFSSILTPNGLKWNNRGSVTVIIPDAKISLAIDNLNGYCSIIKRIGSEAALLGIVGRDVIANVHGNVKNPALALLSANSYSSLISPYIFTKGVLKLSGKVIPSGSPIGLSLIPPSNPCTSGDYHYIDARQLNQIKKERNPSKAKELLKKALIPNPLSTLITLSITETEIIGINTHRGEVIKITKNKKPRICTVEKLEM